jgi:hydroxymethylglutaryl-CoA reductase
MANSKKSITGFSKLSKRGKIKWIVENFFKDPKAVTRELMSYWHSNEDQQKILDGFSENTITNFPMPYGVAPNFVINGETYCIPMVIEESSVVAAASNAAKFWMQRGGFKTTVLNTQKVGQLHFLWKGPKELLTNNFEEIKVQLINSTQSLTSNMEQRGGGISRIELVDKTTDLENFYQLQCYFETCDSMGANFINSVLEKFGSELNDYIQCTPTFKEHAEDFEVIMAILSNYTPECVVRAEVSCKIDQLEGVSKHFDAKEFSSRFKTAVDIARIDPYRATTHNKGIYNGIDAVVLATGNDFRAIEACGHSYASKDGQYRSLSHCTIENGTFRFWLEVPLAVGTVGGLTSLHPMAKRSLELLGNPSAPELMQIIAAAGLAQNFGAVRSLVTTGIQRGHMRMHLMNILHQLEATEKEIKGALVHFNSEIVSFVSVRNFLDSGRGDKEIKIVD